MRHQWNFLAVGGTILITTAMVRIPMHDIAARRRPRPVQTAVPEPRQQQVRERFRRLPLAFVPNEGQLDPAIRFRAQGRGPRQ
jgi:hypothetical protein